MYNTQENTPAQNTQQPKSDLDKVISFMEIALKELKEAQRANNYVTDPELLKEFYNEAYEQGWDAACENIQSNFNPRISIEEGPFTLDCYLTHYDSYDPTEDLPCCDETINIDKVMRLVKEIFKINI
jgi:hypothetical protein